MPAWNSFEHFIWRNLTQSGLAGHDDFLLAVSGGLDSMVMMELFSRIKPGARLEIFHFHHGKSSSPEVSDFRDSSKKLIEENAKIKNIPFYSEESPDLLLSEDDCRNARWRAIRLHAKPGQIIVTAHHHDDRLETMLLKLLRGTGIEGIAGFTMWNNEIFRPFLNVSKNEMLSYAETNKLQWAEDPTNKDSRFLRNWLREIWLPLLEQRVPGAASNLSKSLQSIINTSTEIQDFELKYIQDRVGLSRDWYNLLSSDQKLRALAVFLREQRIYEFTSGQLMEIRKRLDKNQKDITFDLLGKKWVINATQIMLE